MANPLGKKILAVSKPARYTGGEYGAFCKPWKGLKWALAFPEVYEIGMSHLGLQILYNVLNSEENILADRVFAPWFDMEELLKSENQLLWGLETGRPLKDFDILGISIPFELTYTNIISIIKLGGIPVLAKERGEADPLVIGGGCGAFNPEPVADFFDAILLGDGEEAVIKISSIVASGKEKGFGRKELVDSLKSVEGIYIPALTTNQTVNRAVVANLDNLKYPEQLVVPNIQVVHDRVGIEIQRGCTRGCRFCQAGMVYRPDRQRSAGLVSDITQKSVASSGLEECAFLSLSAGDYQPLAGLIVDLNDKLKSRWVHISLPSLRVESLNANVVSALSRSLKGGFTLAPEAATDRLRAVINKGNSEDDLLQAIEKVFSTGWKNIKLYFMIGLPTETAEDIAAIPELAKKAVEIGRRVHRFPNITINVSTFVPKSHTPFQWEHQISMERTYEIQDQLRREIKGPGIKLKLHSPKTSMLEGIFARGGRELSKVIMTAYDKGCRFDAWDEHLLFNKWLEVLDECSVNPETALKGYDADQTLPWDHLFVKLDKKFLLEEREKAIKGESTPDCSLTKCTKCGVCDFDKIKPRVLKVECITHSAQRTTQDAQRTTSFSYRINFSKTGEAAFVGHLDLMKIFKRALGRAGLPLKYSQGYNPRPKLSFADALSLGVESLNEYCDIEMTRHMPPCDIKSALEASFPAGININEVDLKNAPLNIESNRYTIEGDFAQADQQIERFSADDNVKIVKKGKKGPKEVDLKASVIALAQISDRVIEVEIKRGGASVFDFVSYFFGIDAASARALNVKKVKTCLTN